MEVVSITRNKKTNNTKATAEIIDLLEDALNAAKTGQYQSIAMVAVQSNGDVSDGIAGDIGRSQIGLQGGLVNLSFSVARHQSLP